MAREKKERGPNRMRQLGKLAVVVWTDAPLYCSLTDAAADLNVSIPELLRLAGAFIARCRHDPRIETHGRYPCRGFSLIPPRSAEGQ